MKKQFLYITGILVIFLSSCSLSKTSYIDVKKQYSTSQILSLQKKNPLVKFNGDTLFFENL